MIVFVVKGEGVQGEYQFSESCKRTRGGFFDVALIQDIGQCLQSTVVRNNFVQGLNVHGEQKAMSRISSIKSKRVK